MERRNDDPTRNIPAETSGILSRRRILQLAGAGIVGTAVTAGTAAAESGSYSNTLEIVAKGKVSYAFTTTGPVERLLDNGDNSAETGNDTIVENGDGAWTVEGFTGNGYGDGFSFDGSVTEFEVLQGKCTIYLNGEEISPEDLVEDPDTHVIEIVAEDLVSYTFSTTGPIEMLPDNGDNSAETGNDSVTENDDGTWTAEGFTGNGYGDGFSFDGSVTDFVVLEGACTIYLDGREVSIEELVGEEADAEDPEHLLEIVVPDSLEYSFTTTGEIAKDLDNGDNSAEETNDIVTENDDGTWTAEGFTGNGYGDGYTFEGTATAFSPMEGDFTLYLDGEEITPYELVGEDPTHTLEIVVPDELDYSFTSTGPIEKDLDNGDNSAEETNDIVTENDDGTWTAEGYTGNGYGDTFVFERSVTDFSPMEGEFALYLDGEQVTPYELTGEEEPETTTNTVEGGPVGGGQGYDNLVSRDEADVVISTKSGLLQALSNASSGDVVYLAGNASIDMGTTDIVVPSGVTLASNRGIDDAPGGHLYTDEETKSIYLNSGARFTGIRVEGPFYEYFDPDWYATGSGVRAVGGDVEIDNNEIWGFAYASVVTNGNSPHVHHNNIHHNPRDGLGYGVVASSGRPVIEWNAFDYNRHSVASSGSGGYVVRYNHFGSSTIGHVIDMHKPGGTDMEIYRNTVEATYSVADGDRKPAVAIRGVPEVLASVQDNWFYNEAEPLASPDGWTGESIIQVHVDEWANVEFPQNHYGSSEPAADIGCPR
ncbi:Uncharacterized protein HSRCO_1688 [Halanaeroarchaeum sp. HSR-CO]|uniref:hypothetical protein n=1 Tax=Halanaeroarchaeum sp. HSR-CO TaxID=2866382 RepID=UPI00217EE4CA|nr:hypothetical protein [Halanaeroarchaeum sp. HSR-CO]UWG47967.1 Uncharacterized protein HSRCO_1688 [Halanaeroarchaeum sp. HSR-CO]